MEMAGHAEDTKGKACEAGGRDESVTPANQGLAEPSEARREAQNGFSHAASRRNPPYSCLDFEPLASRL